MQFGNGEVEWGNYSMEADTSHLCFEVKDLEAYRDDLIHKGVTISAITVGMDNSKQAWIKDPDGNDIELMEYTTSSFQMRGVIRRMLFKRSLLDASRILYHF